MEAFYDCICANCKYTFEIAMGYGRVNLYLRHQRILADVKAEKYGIQGKEFFEVFPDGSTSDEEEIILKCEKCAEYIQLPQLTLCVRNDKIPVDPMKDNKYIKRKPPFDVEYACWEAFDEYYIKFETYKHICAKCGSVLTPTNISYNDFYKDKLKCPKCNSDLKYIAKGWMNKWIDK